MRARRPSRLALTLMLTATTLGGTVVAAIPAQAVPPGCSWNIGLSDVVNSAGTVTSVNGYYYFVCEGKTTPGTVDIYKANTLVATGTGTASYTCNGSTSYLYSEGSPGSYSKTYACG